MRLRAKTRSCVWREFTRRCEGRVADSLTTGGHASGEQRRRDWPLPIFVIVASCSDDLQLSLSSLSGRVLMARRRHDRFWAARIPRCRYGPRLTGTCLLRAVDKRRSWRRRRQRPGSSSAERPSWPARRSSRLFTRRKEVGDGQRSQSRRRATPSHRALRSTAVSCSHKSTRVTVRCLPGPWFTRPPWHRANIRDHLLTNFNCDRHTNWRLSLWPAPFSNRSPLYALFFSISCLVFVCIILYTSQGE